MQTGLTPATEYAYAKLTVYLHVTGERDDGFHLLEAEMVSLDFADTLEITKGSGLEVIGSGPHPVPSGPNNLVTRALRLIERDAHVLLTKKIPAGGGLGGGSTDAAAILRWGGVDDLRAAASLGADVPFCVRGGRARVTGVGEQIEPLPYEKRTYTLLTPPFGVNTAAVYGAFGARNWPPDAFSERNHLQAAALAVEPRLREWADLLRQHTGNEPVLAGSGSTWFVQGEWREPPPDLPEGAHWTVATTVPAAEGQ